MHTPLYPLLAGALIAGLVYAIWTDLRERIIPNPLNAAIALAAPLWWWTTGVGLWPGVPVQFLVAGIALLVFLGAFAMGAMGGGDVKLIAALGLWLVPLDFLTMLVWMAIGGGVLTVATVAWHHWRRHEGRPEIPYGVAIAGAAIPLIAERYVYHFWA